MVMMMKVVVVVVVMMQTCFDLMLCRDKGQEERRDRETEGERKGRVAELAN